MNSQVSETFSSQHRVLELGSEPQVIHARNDAEDHEVYMGEVSGITLAKLYERFGIPLLDGNVRHFLGQVGPNKGIAQTLEESPSISVHTTMVLPWLLKMQGSHLML